MDAVIPHKNEPAPNLRQNSIVVLESQISEIENELLSYTTIFVKSTPLSGKTSLLQQINSYLKKTKNQKTIAIEFRREVDLGFALQKMAEALQIPIRESDPKSTQLYLQDQILEKIEGEQICLILDNLDLVRSGESFFEFLIKNLNQGRLIASGDHIPAIDPLLTMDFRLHFHNGLSTKEIEQLISQSRISTAEGALSSLATKLYELTSGNPYLIKLILSPAILDNRELTEADLNKNILGARSHYLKRIFESLDAESQNILIKASLLRYSNSYESKILGELSPAALHRISTVGMVTSSGDSLGFTSISRDFLQTRYNDSVATMRNEICSELESVETYEERKELIFQLIQVGRLEDAAKAFNQLVGEFNRHGDLTDLVKLSDSINEIISIEAFEARGTALRFLGHFGQVKEEAEARLTKAPKKQEAAMLCLVISMSTFHLNDVDQTIVHANRAMELMQDIDTTNPTYIESLLILARCETFYDVHKALTLIQKAESLIRMLPTPSDELLAFLHLRFYECFTILADFQNFTKHASAAGEHFRRANDTIQSLITAVNLANGRYDSGLVTQSLIDLREIHRLAEHYGHKALVATCIDIRARHLTYQGRHDKAARLWEQVHNWEDSSNLTYNDWLRCQSRLWSFPKTGKYPDAISFINSFLNFDYSKKNRTWGFLAQEMKYSIENLQLKNFHKLFRQHHPDNLQILALEDRVFLKNFQLELNWMNFLPVQLERQLDFPASESPTHVSVPYKMVYRCLSGLHYLFEGQPKRAEALLSSATTFFKESEHYLWELRALLGLSMIHLQQNRASVSMDLLDRAKDLVARIDHCFEVDLCSVLLAMASLKVGRLSNFENYLDQIPSKSPLYYFYQVLASHKLAKSETQSGQPIEAHQKRFFDQIISFACLEAVSKVTLQTRAGHSTHFKSAIPHNILNDAELVIDEMGGVIRSRKTAIDLKGKEVLGALLKFFLSHPDDIFSKEELTVQVWHEQYNPLVHDTRIYTSIRRLRLLLEPDLKKEPIETLDGSYRLTKDLRYVLMSEQPAKDSLSERQKWVLKYIETNGSIDRLTAQKLLKTSRTPMMNEIKMLVSKGLIQPHGRGKLIKYQLASPPS